MAETDPAVQNLLDIEGCRAATIRYCRGADRLDAELISSAFHPDGNDGPHNCTGAEAGELVVKALTNTAINSENSLFFGARSTQHFVTTQTIEVYGDTAAGESYFTTLHFGTRDGVRLRLQTYGRWIDRFEKRNGEWRISDRRIIMHLVDENAPPDGPWMASGGTLADAGDAPRDKSDPSYGNFAGAKRGEKRLD